MGVWDTILNWLRSTSPSIGQSTYKLELPPPCKLHPVFHVSQLKLATGDADSSVSIPPQLNADLEMVVQPESLLDVREILHPQGKVKEVLLKWQGLPEFEATWEDAMMIANRFSDFHLEDKMVLWKGGNVMHPPKAPVLFTHSRWSKAEARSTFFFKQEMELSLVGLQNAGKTSLVNAIATGGYNEDMIPTVGFNMRKVTKGNVTIKLWDLGGQKRFRSMWERYCRGVAAIVYIVDAADRDSIPISQSELHELLEKPSLTGIPLLVLGNKIDKSEAIVQQALMDQLGLQSITDREVCCYMISCKDSVNLDIVIDWLIKHSKVAK